MGESRGEQSNLQNSSVCLQADTGLATHHRAGTGRGTIMCFHPEAGSARAKLNRSSATALPACAPAACHSGELPAQRGALPATAALVLTASSPAQALTVRSLSECRQAGWFGAP